METSFDKNAGRIDLVPPEQWQNISSVDLTTAIKNRKSHRKYQEKPLSLEELSYLLWATQGIRDQRSSGPAMRTVPSEGGRHSFETYLCAFNVINLEIGVYRYLPMERQLYLEFTEDRLTEKVEMGARGQKFAGRSAVTFIWTAIPYRTERPYGAITDKFIALDAGHVVQNLYLACEAVGAGTCAIADYDQELMNKLLKVDGDGEFVIYLAPVGKI